jgi:hypothetical protein
LSLDGFLDIGNRARAARLKIEYRGQLFAVNNLDLLENN